MVFDEQGKIKHITVGYVTDRFTGDTTKGKGAVFGLYEVMGIGVPGDVGSAFLRVTQSLSGIFKLPISYSADKDLPAWWTDKRRGADP